MIRKRTTPLKKTLDNRPVGIFDSGLGGLTVVSALKQSLPSEEIIYLGDTARVPYGNKSASNIAKFATEDALFLYNKGVKMIIVACNTVASIAMEKLREKFSDIPIIGVLEAGVMDCVSKKPKRVALIGTKATVRSDTYRREIHKFSPSVSVLSIPCPLFVPIVEEGLEKHQICRTAVEYYLSPLVKSPPDILLLACTHYPLLLPAIKDFFHSKKIAPEIIDSANACARYAKNYLKKNYIEASSHSTGGETYYVTDMPSAFVKQAERFLGREISNFEKISL